MRKSREVRKPYIYTQRMKHERAAIDPEAMLSIGLALARARDEESVARLTVGAIRTGLGVPIGAVVLRPDQESPKRVWVECDDVPVKAALAEEMKDVFDAYSDAPTGSSQQLCLEIDVQQAGLDEAAREGLRRLLAVQLASSEGTWGIAIAGKRSSEPYAQEERRALEAVASQGTMALRRAKLKAQAWHDANQFAVLRSVSAAMSGIASLSKLLDSALAQMMNLTGMEGGAILLLDDEQHWLTLAVNRNLPEDARGLIERSPIRVGEFVPGIAVQRGELIVIANVQDDQRELAALKDAGIITHACIPLTVRGQPMGVLSLIDRRPLHFSARYRALLKAVGEEIGVAIDGTRLYTDLTLWEDRNRALVDLMAVATSGLDVTKVIEPVAEQMKRLIDFDGLCVAVGLPNEGSYDVLMLHSPPGVQIPPLLGERVPVDAGTPGEAILTGRPILRKNLPHDSAYPREAWLAEELKFRSALHVPLRSLGRVIGVLIFVSRQRAAYADAELEIAEEISDRFGVVVDYTLRRRSANLSDDDVTQSFIDVVRELAEERVRHGDSPGTILAERMAAKLAAYLPYDADTQLTDTGGRAHRPEDYLHGLPDGFLQAAYGRENPPSESADEFIRRLDYIGSHALTEDLTEREREVLRLIAGGLRNKEIAQQLGLAQSTVKFHVSHIFEKLGVSSRTEAVTKAFQLGILAPP